jgi:hypothetical protein
VGVGVGARALAARQCAARVRARGGAEGLVAEYVPVDSARLRRASVSRNG